MNERIKELMPKAWTFPYPDRELYTKEQMEHFAELIVKQCIAIAVKNANIDAEQETWYLIEQHFGVK